MLEGLGLPVETANDIHSLAMLGRLEETVEFAGHTFTLRTLTTGEDLAVALAIKDYTDTIAASKAFVTATVAAALSHVDGRPFYPPLGPSAVGESVTQKLDAVKDYHYILVENLYEYYINMLERQLAAVEAMRGKSKRSRPTPSPSADSSNDKGSSEEI